MTQDKDTQGQGDAARRLRKEREELAREQKAKDELKEEDLERARRDSTARRAE